MRRENFVWPAALSLILWCSGCGGGSDSGQQTGGGEDVTSPGDTTGPETATKKKIDPATTGKITGAVHFHGDPPALPDVDMSAKPECAALHSKPVPSDRFVVGEGGGLANAVVYVKKGLEGYELPAPSGTAVLDQKGCIYIPHVVVVVRGQELEIRNSDPLVHNFNGTAAKVNRIGNETQQPGQVDRKPIKAPEKPFEMRCDIHSWMSAWIVIVPNVFYAKTGEDGAFEISGLPPGDYELEVWHEQFPPKTVKATVKPGATEQVEIHFGED